MVKVWVSLRVVRVSVNPWTSEASCVYMCDEITGETVYLGEIDRAYAFLRVCVWPVTLTLLPNTNYRSVQTGVQTATPRRCQRVYQNVTSWGLLQGGAYYIIWIDR